MKTKINKRTLIIGSIAVVVIVSILFLLKEKNGKETITFETVKANTGPISNVVTATGTLEALKTVEVGTQVSGVISKIYVDFNTFVKRGQLLAEIDKTPLIASLEDAQASLDDANAEFIYQTSNYNRIKALFDKALVAKSDFDQATYNLAKAQAGLKLARARYDKAKVNLNYATIYSPIDGVVLNRAVDEGQTVAASFNTPTLFSIANDLTRMQVEANIDEADIGLIKFDQEVQFTVDAFPDLSFTGKVIQVRLQPVTVSNVVTYTVIVEAANPDKKLMPGMTANITITVEHSDNAVLIPYKALRFHPDSNLMRAYHLSHPNPDMRPMKKMGPKPDRKREDIFKKSEKVWVKKGDEVFPIPIETGITDGTNIEVKKGLKPDDEVILSMGSTTSNGANNATSNPFMPKPPSRRR
jgi:HlyD family secretion protein